jgi:hypothetical protein
MNRQANAIYGTTRWRSYALFNAAMNFDAAGDTASASALYIRALEVDDANIAARLNLGALLLEREDDRVHSAMKQLVIAKKEAILDYQTENDAVYYSATFKLAGAMYQTRDLTAALKEAQELDEQIDSALNAIRERRKTPAERIRRYAFLRSIPGCRGLAARMRRRFRRNLLRPLENDALFGRFLEQLKPSVIVMIAGLKKESGKKVSPPKITDRDLWRPTAAFQYNLACTATVWLADARNQIAIAEEEKEAAVQRIEAVGDDVEDHHKIRAAAQRVKLAKEKSKHWTAEEARWREDALAHLEFALRLDARMSVWAARDRSMEPLMSDKRFKELLDLYKPALVVPQPAATVAVPDAVLQVRETVQQPA